MSEILEFSKIHNYPSTKIGITIPVTLSFAGESVVINAKLDTGASFSIFARDFAELLGIEVETGTRQSINSVNGQFTAFGHELTINTLGLEWYAMVYFFEDINTNKNVLGRTGWLDRIQIGIIDYECKLFLSYLS